VFCIDKTFLSLLKQTGIELYGVACLVPKETPSVLSAAGGSAGRIPRMVCLGWISTRSGSLRSETINP